MSKYRKKPVVVDAIRVSEVLNAINELSGRCPFLPLPHWLGIPLACGDVVVVPPVVSIKTLEGVMQAGPDDWIIRGIKGELYPCKPDIFEATYEEVKE